MIAAAVLPLVRDLDGVLRRYDPSLKLSHRHVGDKRREEENAAGEKA
jgi:hypothetical protein